MEIISLVRGIPCDVGVSELREKATAIVSVLLSKYSKSEHPLLHGHIQDLEKGCERLNESSSTWKKVFWLLHVYLSFYAHPETPLHPRTPSEKGFLNYWMYLYRKAKTEQ